MTTKTDKYRVVHGYDEYEHESPEEYALFRVISFGRRHGNYKDPDIVLACQYESDDPDSDYYRPCDQLPWVHADGELLTNFRAVEDPITDHPYTPDPDILAVLSYFEHGMCRWGLQGTMQHTPDFRWDGVSLAGVLMWDPSEGDKDGSERKWWDELDEKKRDEIASAFLEEYTDWSNGSIFYVTIQRWIANVCGACLQPNELGIGHWENVESVGGIVGYDQIKEQAKYIMPDLPNDVEWIEK